MKVGGMFVAFSADEMEYLIKVMRGWELPLNNTLMEKLNIDKDTFYYHYAHETLFTATQLKEISPNFIKIVDDVRGAGPFFGEQK